MDEIQMCHWLTHSTTWCQSVIKFLKCLESISIQPPCYGKPISLYRFRSKNVTNLPNSVRPWSVSPVLCLSPPPTRCLPFVPCVFILCLSVVSSSCQVNQRVFPNLCFSSTLGSDPLPALTLYLPWPFTCPDPLPVLTLYPPAWPFSLPWSRACLLPCTFWNLTWFQ
jgi:hypothetical protein